jgi:hypothetical protein
MLSPQVIKYPLNWTEINHHRRHHHRRRPHHYIERRNPVDGKPLYSGGSSGSSLDLKTGYSEEEFSHLSSDEAGKLRVYLTSHCTTSAHTPPRSSPTDLQQSQLLTATLSQLQIINRDTIK